MELSLVRHDELLCGGTILVHGIGDVHVEAGVVGIMDTVCGVYRRPDLFGCEAEEASLYLV